MNILEKKNKNGIHTYIYIFYLIVYLFTLTTYGMGNNISRIRYYILGIAVFLMFITLILKYGIYFFKNKNIYSKELLLSIFTSLIFLITSIYKAYSVEHSLAIRTIVQITLILFPALYAFGFNNIFSTKKIIKLMKFTLIATIVAYFCESEHNLFSFFNLSNWLDIKLFSSISFTESSLCSETFLQLFLFFNYFKTNINDEKDRKNLKIYSYTALIFTILSFKRLAVLFVIIIFISSKFIDFRQKIDKKICYIIPLFFTIITIFYLKFMLGEINVFGINVYELTTGRDYILSLWAKKDFFSYGYGTSMLVIGRYLEMDLIQIYLELNVFCLFVFSYNLFKVSKNILYSVIIMIYTFLNMLTASSLPTSLAWIILLINVSLISSNKCVNEKIINEHENKKRSLEEKEC